MLIFLISPTLSWWQGQCSTSPGYFPYTQRLGTIGTKYFLTIMTPKMRIYITGVLYILVLVPVNIDTTEVPLEMKV